MFLRTAVLALFFMLAPLPGQAKVTIVPDADNWIEAALQDIAQGKTDEFSRKYLKLIDKEAIFDSFSANIRPLSRVGAPVFTEKASDVKYGAALREVIFVALYQDADYVYFKFTIKKNRGGWVISNFSFATETGQLFPKDFLTLQ